MTLSELGTRFWMRRQIMPGATILPLQLPGLRLFTLASSYDEAYGLTDWSGVRFAATNVPVAGMATTWPGVLVPYVEFDSGAAYYTSRDTATLSPTGDVTVGGWFYMDALGVQGAMINKWYTTGNERSYNLHVAAGGALTFEASSDGSATAGKLLSVAGGIVTAGQWWFGVGRLSCSATQGVCLDGTWTTVSTAIPTATYDCARSLYLGRYNESATTWFNGRIAQFWICAYAVPDAWIAWLWENQAPYFGRA